MIKTIRSFQLSLKTFLFLILVYPLFSQVTPTIGLHKNTPRVFYFKGANIVTKPGHLIENGELVIRDGIIESRTLRSDDFGAEPPPLYLGPKINRGNHRNQVYFAQNRD